MGTEQEAEAAICTDPECIDEAHLTIDERCVSYDPEANPVRMHAATLRESNEARVKALEEMTGHPDSLENAFDALKMVVLLEHIAIAAGVRDNAELDFQGRRSTMLDNIERKVGEMQAAKRAAEEQARLAGVHGSHGPRGRRGPGGLVIPE